MKNSRVQWICCLPRGASWFVEPTANKGSITQLVLHFAVTWSCADVTA